MNELSRESRALLAAARHRDGLSAADKDRIRGKITRRLGAGLALGSAVTASATVAEAAHTTVMATVASWLPAAAKVIGVVALAGGVTVGVVRVTHPAARPSAAVAAAPRNVAPAQVQHTAPPREVTQSALVPDEPAQAIKPEATEPPAVRESAPSAKRELRNPNAPLPAMDSQPAANSAPVDDGLSSQVAAIREARAAIRRGDGRAALTAIDRGLPQGQAGPLEQEATLARVTALCLLGDVATARRTAEQFLARFPGSLLASRVRSSCAFSSADSP
jgi:hypothetical protein